MSSADAMPEWLGRQDRGAISLLRTASAEPAHSFPRRA